MRVGKLIFGVGLIILIVLAGFGQAVYHLWNWLMPEIFGLRAITYWQGVGLMLLSWLLFGGLRGWFPGSRFRGMHGPGKPMWVMSAEEREKFRQGLRAGCGPFGGGRPEESKA
jgi:hypothetical protein